MAALLGKSFTVFIIPLVLSCLSPVILQYVPPCETGQCQVTGAAPNITCTSRQGRECSNTQWPSVGQTQEVLPSLEGVTLEDRLNNSTNTTYKSLKLTWSIPSSALTSTKGFYVEWAQGQSKMFNCATLDFRDSQLVNNMQFSYSCFPRVLPGECFIVKVTSMPLRFTATYNITLPDDLNSIDSKEPKLWSTITAITADLYNAQVTVAFSGVPHASFTFRHYQVMLQHESHPHAAMVNKDAASTYHTFLNLDIGIYSAKIKLVGASCGLDCPEIQTGQINLEKSIHLNDGVTDSDHGVTKDNGGDVTTESTTLPSTGGKTTPTTTDGAGKPIVEPSPEQEEYEKQKKIVGGTVGGVVGAAILVGVAVYLYKRNHRPPEDFQMRRFSEGRDSNSSLTMEQAFKAQATVLILYSYDCIEHEKVVCAFANYLKAVGGCEVHLDIWAQNEVQEQGFYWLTDKIDKVDFVIMVCSTGARYKCSRNRKSQKIKQEQPFPDMFASAVEHVAEKMRLIRNEGDSLEQFIVVYFEYSTESDIPHKLELANRYKMVGDIFTLYCHLHGVKVESAKSIPNNTGILKENYHQTQTGQELKFAIEDAAVYFKNNPDWLGEKLESLQNDPIETSSTSETSDKNNVNSGVQNGKNEDVVPSLDDDINPLEKSSRERHLHRSHKDSERLSRERTPVLSRERTPDSIKETDSWGSTVSLVKINIDELPNSPSMLRSPGGSSQGTMSPKGGAKDEGIVNPLFNIQDEDLDDQQLQRDLDFIQNNKPFQVTSQSNPSWLVAQPSHDTPQRGFSDPWLGPSCTLPPLIPTLPRPVDQGDVSLDLLPLNFLQGGTPDSKSGLPLHVSM
ncbi:unnamed protein product [Owenia fusiformis]|uniref:SEFIR domain-containing protein n=1 Tax=Owenia fusiformis TaxID=6347 RepID=A0A8S4NQY8_OWEFU|nr:unnamed protein product [Owenia fusiformis]